MTLVQVLADETSAHMSCDFRLTDPYTGRVTQRDAHKLVTVSKLSISALIGITGVAFLDGRPVGQWIAEAMAGLEENASITDIYGGLRQAGTALSKIADRRVRRTTFVVTSMVGTQSMVTLVSNFEVFMNGRINRATLADADMTVSSIKPKAASFFATGEVDKITSAERDALRLSLRAGVSDSQIHEELRQVNEAVSRRANDTVSIGCYTASLHATGTGSTQPFLTDEQPGSFIPPETAELWNRLGLRFDPQIGADGRPVPMKLIQSGSVTIGSSPEYFREQLKLQPDNADLWNNYGNFLKGRRQPEKAIEAYQKAIDLNPSHAIALSNLAAMQWEEGNIAEAEQLYARAVAASEPSVPAVILSNFATFCDEALSETQRAALLHERAASDENFPLAEARQALFILKHENDLDRANSLLANALAKQPDNPQILYLAGKADWFYNKDSDAAIAKLHKACSLDPRDINVLGFAAYAAMKSGDSASAAYYCRKLLKVFPTAEVQANYAIALLMEGKPEGALRHLSRAARSFQDDRMISTISTIRAAALWILRRHEEAVVLIHTILSAAPTPEIELEVLGMLHLVSPASAGDTDHRIRELIASGVRSDGYTIRSMVRNKPQRERDDGYRLADIIEGTLDLPAWH
jgi:Tfp pilus assembly protein PilF